MFPAVIFASVVAVVFVVSGGEFVRWILERLGRRPKTVSKSTLILKRFLFFLSGVGIGCIAYGYFIEPYWPEITSVKLTSPKIPVGSKPIRFVQISDLHCDPCKFRPKTPFISFR